MVTSIPEILRSLNEARRGTRDGAEDDAGYSVFIDVVGDIGRAFGEPDPEAFRRLLPHFASLREQLEYGGSAHHSPYQALAEQKDDAFLAGALWAVSDVINAYLRQADDEQARGRARGSRTQVRRVALELLEANETVRHGDVLAGLESRGATASKSLVSRAMADLIEDDVIERVDAHHSDARQRFFALKERDRTAPPALLVELRGVADQLVASLDGPRAAHLLEGEAARVAAC